MGIGFLKIETRTGEGALPVAGAAIAVRDGSGALLFDLATDDSGTAPIVELYAPDIVHTLDPNDPGPYYATYTVEAAHPSYDTMILSGVQIFDTETTILPIDMVYADGRRISEEEQEIAPSENPLHSPEERPQEGDIETGTAPRVLRDVIIPDYITVHLGTPNANAANVRVSFRDYIKNVASHEIYPTWPRAALEANIYAQISFVLNRIYTEWYPSRGYNFNITNSTGYVRMGLSFFV